MAVEPGLTGATLVTRTPALVERVYAVLGELREATAEYAAASAAAEGRGAGARGRRSRCRCGAGRRGGAGARPGGLGGSRLMERWRREAILAGQPGTYVDVQAVAYRLARRGTPALVFALPPHRPDRGQRCALVVLLSGDDGVIAAGRERQGALGRRQVVAYR